MNVKGCFAWIIVAVILAAGMVVNGYFVSQQMVNHLKAQEEAFYRAMQNAPQQSLDNGG